MVDAEPGNYRPRRAIPESGPAPEPPKAPPVDDGFDDDERPKPLYRDEVDGAETSSSPTGSTSEAAAPTGSSGSTAGPSKPITFTPRKPRPADDDEATTILPRTGSSRRRPSELDEIDDDEHRPIKSRTRLALLIGGVAAVVVVGLAIGYAVSGVGNTPQTTPSQSGSVTAPSGDPSGTADPNVPGELLNDGSLVSAADASLAVSGRDWKVVQPGTGEDAPRAACFGTEPVEGQPTAQQRLLRVLGSTGKNPPGLLHEATAYGSPEEAVQAYAIATKTLGGCAVTGSYIVEGKAVSGLGDQATGVVIASLDGSKVQQHTVVVNRTGRVLNIVDVTQPDKAVSATNVAKAAAAVTGRECATAGGACVAGVAVKNGPPPIGGDEPGFLAAGDLPPAGKTPMPWGATAPEVPKADFTGSNCETVNWTTLSTVATTSRVYIPQDSGTIFGLNQVVVTMKDKAAATKLVDKLESDLKSCAKRKLTAKVSDPKKVSSVGAQKTAVEGYTAEVSQKTTDGTKSTGWASSPPAPRSPTRS